MKFIVLLLIIAGCSQHNSNWRHPSSEPTTKVQMTRSPRCVQILLRLGLPERFPHLITAEMLNESGMSKSTKILVKDRQLADIDYMAHEAIRTKKLQRIAEEQLYAYTKKYTKRLKSATQMSTYIKKNFGIDYKHKFGFSYGPLSRRTSFSNFGNIDVIESMEVAIYKNSKPSPRNLIKKVPMKYNRSQGIWTTATPGDFEGKWFQYNVTFKDGTHSFYSEPLPKKFSMVDHTAPKISRSQYGTSQIYYLPDPSLRPPAPKLKKSPKIWEIHIADLTPTDVDPKYWGTSEAIIRSKEMMRKISHYDGIEVMPLRNAVMFENIGDDTIYLHHWGYMGTDFGFSERFGGIEGIISLIDTMHANGKVIYTDHVLQHSANGHKPFEWMLGKPHVNDITGCGNTLNMEPGSVLEQLTMQNFKRDLFMIGFDGSRQDLAGALPKQTFENLKNVAHAGGKVISGEPYGYGGGWSSLSYTDANGRKVLRTLDDPWGPVSGAKLWDVEARDVIYRCVTKGCSAEEFKEFIMGGHHSNRYRLWKRRSTDTSIIIEVHDGTTAAQRLVSNDEALNHEYQKLAYANFIQMTSQGEKVFGPGQASALRFNHLNDNPVQIFGISEQRKWFENNWFYPSANFNTKYEAYFSWDWIDPVTEGHRVSYLPQSDPNALGIHYKQKATDFTGANPKEEVLILYNNSLKAVTFGIPNGQWKTVMDTSTVKVDLNGRIFAPAEGHFTVQPLSGVALINTK